MASAICVPTVCTGLSEVIGSWKIMRDLVAAHRPHLRFRQAEQVAHAPVAAAQQHVAANRCPGRRREVSRMIARLVTLLPEPDSPDQGQRLAGMNL